MENFYVLSDAILYIEEHLQEEITAEEIAESCHYSVSNLKYLFRKVFQYGMMDYVNRRRITEAAGELLMTDKTVCEIAFSYGFRSQEVFSRAFKRIWQEAPGVYRRHRHFWQLFPRQEFLCDECGVFRRRFDISRMREDLSRGVERCALCFDIIGIRQIKAHYGREAGEAVVLEGIRRLEKAAGEAGQIYRIAGDKFVLLMGEKVGETVCRQMEKIMRETLGKNGEELYFHGDLIPVSMFAGWIKLENTDCAAEDLFERLDLVLAEAKRCLKLRFIEGNEGVQEFYPDEKTGLNRGRVSGCHAVEIDGMGGLGRGVTGEKWEYCCTAVLPDIWSSVRGQREIQFCWIEKKWDFFVFFPDGQDWYKRVVYQENGAVLREHYYVIKDKQQSGEGDIDITYLELYLELIVERDGERQVLNQGELKEALYDGRISREEYRRAWNVIRNI